jgi:hypothetical protein
MEKRGNFYAFADKYGADTLGTADLVARDGQQVRLDVVDPQGDLPRRLGSIGVEEDSPGPYGAALLPLAGHLRRRHHL